MESVLLRAEASKGAKLSAKEIAKFEKLCAEIARLEQLAGELQTKEVEVETKRLKDLAKIVVLREVQEAQMEPQSEERTKAILAERAELKKRMRELGYQVNEETDHNSDVHEIVLPYYVWIESWLQTNADAPNIEKSLDCYIEQYSLLPPNQSETKEIVERRIKCKILKDALQHIDSLHWETLNDHLQKTQQFLILLEENAARKAQIDRSFAEKPSSGNAINNEANGADSTKLPYDDHVELDKVNSELHDIHLQMKASTIDPKVAIARLDELADCLEIMEHRASEHTSGFRKFFGNFFKRIKSLRAGGPHQLG